jgi:hypothetical protein
MLKSIMKKSSTKHREKLTWINFFQYSWTSHGLLDSPGL